MNNFADYRDQAHLWITLSTGEYYPDVLPLASELYAPVLTLFGKLLKESHSSTDLMMRLSATSETWMRIQLARVFRKYVSPETPVEMLKQKRKAALICEQFGGGFRRIEEVQAAFAGRPLPDETLCALLWEYKARGKKGYDLTERLSSFYPTEKPEAMLELIIGASSNEGDLVLDAFAGSGTTLAAASRLKRRWIGIDESAVAIRATMDRLRRGLSPMGDFVSKSSRSVHQSELFSAVPENRNDSQQPACFSLWSTQDRLVDAVKLSDQELDASLAA